ncbi:MAG: ribonuclease HII [Gammaproteobacteria bacterium]
MSERSNILVGGVDEAGRGPLAGPVVAAAVILDPDAPIEGLADSKRLTASRRGLLEGEIQEKAIAWSVARVEADQIDRINILQATLLAMRRAVEGLNVTPGRVLVDGNCCPDLGIPAEAIVGGDALEPAISAASILAKEARDRIMRALAEHYPQYGFDRHMGYPTKRHLEALERHGPCPWHRRSFGPVRRVCERLGIDPER